MSWFNHQLSKGLNMRVAHFSIRFCVFVFFTQGGDAKQTGKSSTDSSRKNSWNSCLFVCLALIEFRKIDTFSRQNQYTNPAVPCEFPWEKNLFVSLNFSNISHFFCFVKKHVRTSTQRSSGRSFPSRCGGEFSPLPCFFVCFPLNLAISRLKMFV